MIMNENINHGRPAEGEEEEEKVREAGKGGGMCRGAGAVVGERGIEAGLSRPTDRLKGG
jgi:hypothetical protein